MYTLTPELATFLVSDKALDALLRYANADLSAASLQTLEKLRKEFLPAEAAALVEQLSLRKRSSEKFPHPWPLLFTDEALQQASSFSVASYHADVFARYDRVADLGSGIGGDTLALASRGRSVLSVEMNPVVCQLLQHNVTAAGLADRVRVRCADWTTQTDLDQVQAAFIDPARRVDGQRVFKLSDMLPPITAVLELQARVPDIAVKVAPGISHDELPGNCEVEFISEKGTLKEALLRFGGLRTGSRTTATILPGCHQMRLADVPPRVDVSLPRAWLYEPDPAVLRASLVKDLAAMLDACQLDESIAYLTGDTLTRSPFARAWEVRQHGPFNLKRLNEWLREANAGEVVIKKRGSPIEPDEFQKRLKTVKGGAPVTVFLTKVRQKPWMVLCGPETVREET